LLDTKSQASPEVSKLIGILYGYIPKIEDLVYGRFDRKP